MASIARPRGAARFALLDDEGFRRLAVVGTVLGLFTIADAFIYLTLKQRATFGTTYFPLLYVGTAVSYVVLAIPLGALADRVGRSRVFLAGYTLLLGTKDREGSRYQPHAEPCARTT